MVGLFRLWRGFYFTMGREINYLKKKGRGVTFSQLLPIYPPALPIVITLYPYIAFLSFGNIFKILYHCY